MNKCKCGICTPFGEQPEITYMSQANIIKKLEQELAKLKELLKESIPELESYYRSRRMSDWNNGKSEKREILINKVKQALGE